MGNEEYIVITACGHDKTIDSIRINTFKNEDAADKYCNAINTLELKSDSWVTAKVVSEDKQYPLEAFLPFEFDMILLLDDRSILKFLREIDVKDLAELLKGANDTIKEKIFRNMSERAVKMLKDEIEYLGLMPLIKVKEAQRKMMSIIRHLEDTGEIVINYKKGEMKDEQ
ncbi:hypothetical protein R84B8_01646 [Treponema sp. R8-4-B8]